jgi:hypothetical protein
MHELYFELPALSPGSVIPVVISNAGTTLLRESGPSCQYFPESSIFSHTTGESPFNRRGAWCSGGCPQP